MQSAIFRTATVFRNVFKRSLPIRTSSTLYNNEDALQDPTLEKEYLTPDSEYEELTRVYFGIPFDHRCFIIHPRVKWGPEKVQDTKPEQQMEEAKSLIRTLDPWKVHGTQIVSLESLNSKYLFGSGNLQKLKEIICRSDVTAVFINVSRLKNMQMHELEKVFGVPILDRYRVVLQILKLHALSTHAKLQVAVAETYYLRTRLQFSDSKMIVSENAEKRKLMLQNREQKLKQAIKKLHQQRELLRNRRKQRNYPIVAIVGYTNCGKTSLIKALTGEKKLQPRNELFATLDVTLHAGYLPSNLEVLYVDTVGFISDIPTTLIQSFIATLEDAFLADVIVHVEDIASDDLLHQRNHVMKTLNELAEQTQTTDLLDKMISVGNKCDLIENYREPDAILVSAKTGEGIDGFKQIVERAVLARTNRKIMTLKVRSGSEEMRWLYKNCVVISTAADPKSAERQNMKLIITNAILEQFKKTFL